MEIVFDDSFEMPHYRIDIRYIGKLLSGTFFVGSIPTLILAIIFVITATITVSGMYLDRIAPMISQKINPNPMV